jgi:hypothetical protein
MGTKKYFRAWNLKGGEEGAGGVPKISRREKLSRTLDESAVGRPAFTVGAAKYGMG